MEKLAVEYGDGLFELAVEQGLEEQLLGQTRELRRILRQEPSYISLMNSRNVPPAEKDRLLNEAFGEAVHPYLLNFLRLMNDRGYFSQVPACCARFEDRYCERHGIRRVTVRSATALDKSEKQRVKDSVEKRLDCRAQITWIVDRALVAGLRVEAEGVLIENSAKSMLEGLRRHLGTP